MLLIVVTQLLLTDCQFQIPELPVADFTIDNANCLLPCAVTFNNSSQNASSYQWDFGDGETSEEMAPRHVYKNEGYFPVKLTAKGKGGVNGTTQAISIQNGSTISQTPAAKQYLSLPFATMVLIKGGTFQMGDTRNEGFANEKPVHEVSLSDFYMGQYEVTQRQWKEIMNNNPANYTGCDACPVEYISWNDSQEFIKRLNARTAGKYRLPTEAEWEYAAGGGSGTKTRFGNGKDIADPTEMNFYALADKKQNYSVTGEYRSRLIAVGSFPSNRLGLFDMSGSVWEWCSDYYGETYYNSTQKTNPGGPLIGENRILRGGAWNSEPFFCRITYRGITQFTNASGFGFRIVSSD